MPQGRYGLAAARASTWGSSTFEKSRPVVLIHVNCIVACSIYTINPCCWSVQVVKQAALVTASNAAAARHCNQWTLERWLSYCHGMTARSIAPSKKHMNIRYMMSFRRRCVWQSKMWSVLKQATWWYNRFMAMVTAGNVAPICSALQSGNHIQKSGTFMWTSFSWAKIAITLKFSIHFIHRGALYSNIRSTFKTGSHCSLPPTPCKLNG